MNKSVEIFETFRPRLFRLAYGMLGRTSLAEDIVQEAYIRWQKQTLEEIKSPGAFLSTIVSRICLDEIKSARNRKEQYIGPDLPEPVLASDQETPVEKLELAESLSMAMLVVLEELSPVQRAVFILREVFDYEYASIAEMINKSETHCRKIAQRARDQIQDNKPRFDGNVEEQQQLINTFIEAVQTGELSAIENMLAKDAILYSDGGGKVTAARKPIYTASKIARFLVGIKKKSPPNVEQKIELKNVNGEPGMIIWLGGELYNVWSFHIENDRIKSIYVVLNPEKLRYIKNNL